MFVLIINTENIFLNLLCTPDPEINSTLCTPQLFIMDCTYLNTLISYTDRTRMVIAQSDEDF